MPEQEEDELFGEAAVRLGYCTVEDIEEALEEQEQLESEGVSRLIGMILLEKGKLTNDELIDILNKLQKNSSSPRKGPRAGESP